MRPFRIADRSFNEHSSPPLDGVCYLALFRRRSTVPYTAAFGSNADINGQLPDIAIYEYTP